jgi:1,4-dihydroxy-6-naphthoate synthase
MKLTLGFSPCPNDTFIFDAMVNGKIDTRGLEFDCVIEDVERLNQRAFEGHIDITKLSFNTFLHTIRHYALLHSGSALGKGVGPLLVSKEPMGPDGIAAESRIAIPGINTTANLLCTLAFPKATQKTELVFNEIEDAVLAGAFDAGLIIHEGRFTYEKKGLHKIIDLGEWWETEMDALIPLGGIVVKRSFDPALCATIDAVIRDSIAYSRSNYPALAPFIVDNAQEMEEDVMRKHIELYVNDYSVELGPIGEKAIMTLYGKAREAGLLAADFDKGIFY